MSGLMEDQQVTPERYCRGFLSLRTIILRAGYPKRQCYVVLFCRFLRTVPKSFRNHPVNQQVNISPNSKGIKFSCMFQSFRPQSYSTFKNYSINTRLLYKYYLWQFLQWRFPAEKHKKSVSQKHGEKWDLLEKP